MKIILIAGIGNIFLGDDGFGVEVIAQLAKRTLPPGIDVVDFGIRARDLCYALQDGYTDAILVDATRQGGAPGSLYVIEPDDAADPRDRDNGSNGEWSIAPHDLNPAQVLRMVRTMGGGACHIVLVGCEPESFGTEDEQEGRMGLSAPVASAVPRAVDLVVALAMKMGREPGLGPQRGDADGGLERNSVESIAG